MAETKLRGSTKHARELGRTHAVPLDRRRGSARFSAIIRIRLPGRRDAPVLIALMGLDEGVNVFLDEEWLSRLDREPLHPSLYPALSVPACEVQAGQRRGSSLPPIDVGRGRRLPPTARPLFDGDQPSAATQAHPPAPRCQQFEAAGLRTVRLH